MKIIYLRQLMASLTVCTILAACTTTSVPKKADGSWIELGVSASGNVQHALDSNSIRRQGNLVTFRDRKIVIDPKQQYYSNTPAYKTALSTTQIDCSRKLFRVLDVELLDAHGELIRQDHFGETDLRPMGITSGSASEQQYQRVCSHQL
ncbi:surface-adhesin E family protein [Snodgrassella alvi]|uniref:surface-adhesin E family protein n=1 Tax=Snodgrassella alvi TaxID=1196083 RepID=UPI000C1E4729|nr:surface-adhesin E family protein [Snodgrassella alvi]PIT16952.1 hypothetical protein BGI34_08970 [Snodgrassella alvi]PIT17749.1 hypothetical protein BGI33_02385 [Snodgrassella alvi]